MVELNRYPDNYFAEVEQAAFFTGQRGAGHRLLADKMLQAQLLLWRHAALPAKPAPNHIPGERAEMPVPQLSSRRRDAHG